MAAAQAPPSQGSQPKPCSPGFGALLTADGTSEPLSKGGRTCLAGNLPWAILSRPFVLQVVFTDFVQV